MRISASGNAGCNRAGPVLPIQEKRRLYSDFLKRYLFLGGFYAVRCAKSIIGVVHVEFALSRPPRAYSSDMSCCGRLRPQDAKAIAVAIICGGHAAAQAETSHPA